MRLVGGHSLTAAEYGGIRLVADVQHRNKNGIPGREISVSTPQPVNPSRLLEGVSGNTYRERIQSSAPEYLRVNLLNRLLVADIFLAALLKERKTFQ